MISEMLQNLIQVIIDERKAQKLSQERLAMLSGISRRSIVAIEAGGDFTLSTLGRLYEALGIEAIARRRQRPTLEDAVEENAREFSRARGR